MLKLILFMFLYFWCSLCNAFCVVEDITAVENELSNCEENQLLFGYLRFQSKTSDFKYIYEKSLNLQIISRYRVEILKFIRNHCEYKKNTLKIKEITNLMKMEEKKFINEIIISCRYKS